MPSWIGNCRGSKFVGIAQPAGRIKCAVCGKVVRAKAKHPTQPRPHRPPDTFTAMIEAELDDVRRGDV